MILSLRVCTLACIYNGLRASKYLAICFIYRELYKGRALHIQSLVLGFTTSATLPLTAVAPVVHRHLLLPSSGWLSPFGYQEIAFLAF